MNSEANAPTLPSGSLDADVPRSRPVPQLIVLARRDALMTPGSRHRLDGLDTVCIGRGAGHARQRRTLDLCFADRRLSQAHARLVRSGRRWTLEDRGSTNGTYVDGKRAATAALVDGSLIEIGRLVLMYRDTVPVHALTPNDVCEDTLRPAAPGWATFHDPLEHDWRRLARSAGRVRVLLQGPTGAGKEVAARALHALSGRAGPFMAVNCAGLAPELIAAELFGHRAGAFSGARDARPGYLRAAHGGTLLLDEIDSLPLSAQAALLRPLAEGAVTPVGETLARPFDVLIVAATNRDLDAAVDRGAFREDLLARIAEQVLTLPSVADRREDLGILLRAVLDRIDLGEPRLERKAARLLFGYDWPRNVREMHSALRAALAYAEGNTLRAEHLPRPLAGRSPAVSADSDRQALVDALRDASGNIRRAAESMGIARSTFYRRLERHGIAPDRNKIG